MSEDSLIATVERNCRAALKASRGETNTPQTVVLNGSTTEYVQDRLAEMARLMKTPEWTVAASDDGEEFPCLAVTEPDVDLIVAFVPNRNEYCVIQGETPPYSVIGIWGEPVDCFVAM